VRKVLATAALTVVVCVASAIPVFATATPTTVDALVTASETVQTTTFFPAYVPSGLLVVADQMTNDLYVMESDGTHQSLLTHLSSPTSGTMQITGMTYDAALGGLVVDAALFQPSEVVSPGIFVVSPTGSVLGSFALSSSLDGDWGVTPGPGSSVLIYGSSGVVQVSLTSTGGGHWAFSSTST